MIWQTNIFVRWYWIHSWNENRLIFHRLLTPSCKRLFSPLKKKSFPRLIYCSLIRTWNSTLTSSWFLSFFPFYLCILFNLHKLEWIKGALPERLHRSPPRLRLLCARVFMKRSLWQRDGEQQQRPAGSQEDRESNVSFMRSKILTEKEEKRYDREEGGETVII